MIASDISSKIAMQYASTVDNVVLNHVRTYLSRTISFYFKKNISSHTKVIIFIPNANSIWRFILRKMVWMGSQFIYIIQQKIIRNNYK